MLLIIRGGGGPFIPTTLLSPLRLGLLASNSKLSGFYKNNHFALGMVTQTYHHGNSCGATKTDTSLRACPIQSLIYKHQLLLFGRLAIGQQRRKLIKGNLETVGCRLGISTNEVKVVDVIAQCFGRLTGEGNHPLPPALNL